MFCLSVFVCVHVLFCLSVSVFAHVPCFHMSVASLQFDYDCDNFWEGCKFHFMRWSVACIAGRTWSNKGLLRSQFFRFGWTEMRMKEKGVSLCLVGLIQITSRASTHMSQWHKKGIGRLVIHIFLPFMSTAELILIWCQCFMFSNFLFSLVWYGGRSHWW